MKKLIICGMVLFVLTSCIETQKGEAVKDGLAEVEPTQIEVGTVGDGTSMHSLELVGVFGDTLYFAAPAERLMLHAESIHFDNTLCETLHLPPTLSASWEEEEFLQNNQSDVRNEQAE